MGESVQIDREAGISMEYWVWVGKLMQQLERKEELDNIQGGEQSLCEQPAV